MFASQQLVSLAAAYGAATGKSYAAIGELVFGDHKFFKRLSRGNDCKTAHAATASRWFLENWPKDARWPPDVPNYAAVMSHNEAS